MQVSIRKIILKSSNLVKIGKYTFGIFEGDNNAIINGFSKTFVPTCVPTFPVPTPTVIFIVYVSIFGAIRQGYKVKNTLHKSL